MTEPTGDLLTTPDVPADNQPQQTTQMGQWYKPEHEKIVQAKGWKEPNDPVRDYIQLEKNMGSRVKMPSPESSAEEIRAFYQKTGCPENPEGYELKEVPAGAIRDEDMEVWAREQLWKDGAPKQLGENLIRGFYEQQAQALQKSRETGETQLRQELGTKYEAELTVAKRFCANCSDEFKQLLETTGLGNNPVFVKEFIKLGKSTMSDTLIKGDTSGNKEQAYVPQYKDSPDMYKNGEDEESKKAREYFTAKGYRY